MTITVGDESVVLTEETVWVCLFTEAHHVNHVYYTNGERVFCIFECYELMDNLVKAGFPIQTRRTPKQWDLDAYEAYVTKQLQDLEEQCP